MEIAIRNYEDLLKFVSNENVTKKEAQHLIEKMLGAFASVNESKESLIDATKIFIEKYGYKPLVERPLFII